MAGTSAAENAIVICDESTEWKDNIGSTTKAARTEMQKCNNSCKSAQKTAQKEAEKALKALKQHKAAATAAIFGKAKSSDSASADEGGGGGTRLDGSLSLRVL